MTLSTSSTSGTATTPSAASAMSVHFTVGTQPQWARYGGSGRTSSAPRQLLGRVVVAAQRAGALRHHRHEHRAGHDRVGEERRLGVPGDARLEQRQRDRRTRDGGQPFEPTDHQRGERHQQRRQAGRVAERHTGDAAAQEQREEGQRAGDGPHDGVQPRDRDAEHRRPIAALGAGANGGAQAAAIQEPGDERDGERPDDERDEVVGVEDVAAGLGLPELPLPRRRELPVDRRRRAARWRGSSPTSAE